jgi:hypothetical protein
VTRLNPYFVSKCLIQMRSDASNRPACDSDGDLFVVSLNGSEMQDCRKHPRLPQIQRNSWVLRGHIAIAALHADSDRSAAGPERNVENGDIILKINTRLQTLFGFKICLKKCMTTSDILYFSAAW